MMVCIFTFVSSGQVWLKGRFLHCVVFEALPWRGVDVATVAVTVTTATAALAATRQRRKLPQEMRERRELLRATRERRELLQAMRERRELLLARARAVADRCLVARKLGDGIGPTALGGVVAIAQARRKVVAIASRDCTPSTTAGRRNKKRQREERWLREYEQDPELAKQKAAERHKTWCENQLLNTMRKEALRIYDESLEKRGEEEEEEEEEEDDRSWEKDKYTPLSKGGGRQPPPGGTGGVAAA